MIKEEKQRIRCAIYTRKSSEEGLEQDFNSLDAQREACEAYIKSQIHEGWVLIEKEYNDGGYSGGTMNRPAFQTLMKDIENNEIDIVVVYKVDRLTRSLMDFSKIIDVFNNHETSFVSITQQFNTTTSMGRLTLNILLSFAQFEREVTGERIRDKIAASKKKGMWMGGRAPLGYKINDHKLIKIDEEVKTVQMIFNKYLELTSVPKLMEYLRNTNTKTPNDKNFSKGQLYHMLSNKAYIGKIIHKNNVYDGEHEPIIDEISFEKVQKLLYENKVDKTCGTKSSSNSLLAGLIYDDNENRMTPSHSNTHHRKYRYYVSQAIKKFNKSKSGSVSKIPASEIEKFVVKITKEILQNKKQVQNILSDLDVTKQNKLIETAENIKDYSNPKLIKTIINKIIISEYSIEITFDKNGITRALENLYDNNDIIIISENIKVKPLIVTKNIKISQPSKSGNILILPAKENDNTNYNPYLINAIVKSYYYHKQLKNGKTIEDIQNEENLKDSKYVRNILNLKYLSPYLTEQILNGTQDKDLTLKKLFKIA